ncbi:alpha-(1,3)-fucosyltransferase 4-like [Strix uralensis]|uniref:alpha-(1,3)-fucosyltransferase 4-like n=1 Tax=Strix uralensis TaxID=36305 RepID=UPI003DA74D8B
MGGKKQEARQRVGSSGAVLLSPGQEGRETVSACVVCLAGMPSAHGPLPHAPTCAHRVRVPRSPLGAVPTTPPVPAGVWAVARDALPECRDTNSLWSPELGMSNCVGWGAKAAITCICLWPPQQPPGLQAAGGGRRSSEVNVLLWWEPFGRPQRMADCRRRYNITGCRLSADRSRYAEAQAVLFHHRDLALHGARGLPRGPPPRPPRQLWVWMNFESPSHSPGLQGLAGLFNWTMSYRRDSDVFVPYGYLYAPPAPRPFVLPRKTRLVAWVISNWNEEHARVRYYRQLKEHLAIDVYGARGLALAEGGVVETVSAYKFYLAFENSQHTDYITEKLWRNAFAASAVPVVLGPRRANYERFIPPDSFIHVDDFPSPRLLATYLKFLDKNKPSYRRYFAWRKKYEVHVTSFWDEHFCKVCEVVRAAGNQIKTVRNTYRSETFTVVHGST